MNNRLLQFLAAENISQSQFAETIGVARASVSHIISGRNKPGYEFICSIFEHYPSLNPEWMLLGKGKMYRSPSEKMTSPAGSPSKADNTAVAQSESGSTALQGDNGVNALQFDDSSGETGDNAGDKQLETAFPISPESLSDSEQKTNVTDETVSQMQPSASQKTATPRTITKIIVFYSDNTYQELKG